MKVCPNCKAELEDNQRFCLHCLYSLAEKEIIPPPVTKKCRWPLVLLCFLVLGVALSVLFLPREKEGITVAAPKETTPPVIREEAPDPTVLEIPETRTLTADGVTYTFRPASREDHPTAIVLSNYYVLIRVEGTPSDGVYRIPSFLDEAMTELVTVVAEGAFAGTDAGMIDLGYNVRYVWGNAFGDSALTQLYLHRDVYIEQTAFSCCTQDFTIHCPAYLENTEGLLWSELARDYGFQWQMSEF